MAIGWDSLNLKKQFTFYASYHNERVNVAIHLLCIWPILATSVLLMQYTPAFVATPAFLQDSLYFANQKINLAVVLTLTYCVVYMVMEPTVGAIGAFLLMTILSISAKLVANEATLFGGIPVWKVALAVHVTGWILQFIGHYVFEGRAPALLDSIDQAFLTAPLFVLMEVAFFFGYRRSLYDKIMIEVEANIKEFNASKNKKSK